jgi:hypothetical protein
MKKGTTVFYRKWKDPIYNSTTFWVVIADSNLKDCETFFRKVLKIEPTVIDSATIARCSEIGNDKIGHNIVLQYKSNANMGTIVHEVVHAVNYSFMFRGIKLDTDNDEHQAYYTDFVFRKVLGVFNKFWEVKDKEKKNAKPTSTEKESGK